MDAALSAAAGALLVALLNEARAQLRKREADRDRAARLRDAAAHAAAVARHEAGRQADNESP